MNYYNEIKNELVNNEINKKVKNYLVNKGDLNTYYNVGKMLSEAGEKYGDNIVSKYAEKLKIEVGKKYNVRYLYDMRKLYLFSKVHPLDAQLTISHYRVLFKLKDNNEINYYINQIKSRNLSKRGLSIIIDNKEYERLDNETKTKLINNAEREVVNFVKNPILIKNSLNIKNISEKILQKLILEDLTSFMKELGDGFCFVANEYKIKIGNTYNYIDLLFYWIYVKFLDTIFRTV